jgi:hypothetical protein
MNLKSWRRLLTGYLILCGSILPLQTWLGRTEPGSSAFPRRLVVILDGVPYQTIADLRAEGRFRRFHEPARMISTFPSLTNPAMIEILHESDSVGYEDHYYDRDTNRLRGTIQDRLQGGKFIQGTFRETFDYHAPAFKGALAYLAAPLGAEFVAQLDLGAFRAAFRRSPAPVFVAYIGETDSLAHLGGEIPLKAFLRTVDRAIEELMAESNGGLEVEVFSDHGNRYDEYQHVKLNDALAAAGFVTEKSLRSERSVVLPKHGLVGSSVLFTRPENRARVAEASAAAAGVDFAVYPSGDDTIELLSRRGRARVSRDAERYRYEDLGGDPLQLAPIVRELAAQGVPSLMDAAGFAPGETWWRATQAHTYADPLRRLFDGFGKHVKNRADVIVSYEDGYLLGSPTLTFFARMRATHGNLLRGESEAFAMSTRQNLGDFLRGHELNRYFALDQRSKAGSYFSGTGHCRLGQAMARELANHASR